MRCIIFRGVSLTRHLHLYIHDAVRGLCIEGNVTQFQVTVGVIAEIAGLEGSLLYENPKLHRRLGEVI